MCAYVYACMHTYMHANNVTSTHTQPYTLLVTCAHTRTHRCTVLVRCACVRVYGASVK